MKGFRLKLEEYQQLATNSERDIINFVLEYPHKAEGISVQELAELTYTSPSTVIRLAKKLGCAGYKEFQRSLTYEVALAYKSTNISQEGVLSGDTADVIIQKVSSKNISSVELTRDNLNPQTVETVVRLMHDAHNVNLFGVGASLLVAKDLQLKMLRLNIPGNLCDDLHSQMLYAKNMDTRDVGIMVSYSGLTQEVLECARTVRARGAKVVALTRDFDSPLVHLSDYVLGVAATELLMRTGAMSSRIAQLNVVDILFATYVSTYYEQSIKRASSNWIKKEEARPQ